MHPIVRKPAPTMTDDDRVVPPPWSKENIWEAVGEGFIHSEDLTPDFKLNLKNSLSKTTRFGMQDPPTFPQGCRPKSTPNPNKPSGGKGLKERSPLAPLVVRVKDDFDDVIRRTMGVEIAGQEGVIAEQDQIIAGQELAIETMSARIAYLEKHVELQGNVIGSFCAHFQHKNPNEF